MRKILFLCTHNACRSILSEVISRHFNSGDDLQVASAGSAPAGQVHPLTLKYLAIHGYNNEGLNSQSWDDFADFAPDVVISVCDRAANESCPLYLGPAKRLNWALPDPSHLSKAELANDPQAQDKSFAQVIKRIENRAQALARLDIKTLDDADFIAQLEQIGSL